MARILDNGYIEFSTGKVLLTDSVLTGAESLELIMLVPKFFPAVGMAGFPMRGGWGGGIGGGGSGAQGIPGPAGPINRIQDHGANLPVEGILNFMGNGVTAVDNPGSGRTDVTIDDIYAATRVVSLTPGDGTDLTIASAIAALPAQGGRIFIKQGTYVISAPLALPDKDVVIQGSGDATVISLGSSAIAAFTVPNLVLTAPRRYDFYDLMVLGDGTVSQSFVELADSGGFGSIRCYNVHTLDCETAFNYLQYDQTFSRLTTLACWDSKFIAPNTATAHVLKSVNPGGTYNGAIETRFFGCSFYDPEAAIFTNWKISGEFDILLEGCSDGFVVKDGSNFNGFKFTDTTFWVVNGGTCTFNGGSWGNWFDGIQACNLAANSVGAFGIFHFLGTTRVSLSDNIIRNLKILFDTSNRCGICNNTFQASAQVAANQPDFALHLVGPGASSRITGNMFGCEQAQVALIALVKIETPNNTISGNTFLAPVGANTILEAGAADFNIVAGCTGVSTGAGFTLIGANSRCDVLVVNVP